MNQLSVVIPVYESGKSLEELYRRLVSSLAGTMDQFEVIMVDDGSRDLSWDVIQKLSQKDKRIKGIQLSRNFGQHNALLCGILEAQHDIIATLDDDLQNPPEEIPKLLNKLNEGYDVVYGTPHKKQHGLWRNLASSATNMILRHMAKSQKPYHVTSFRVFRSKVRKAFEHYDAPFVSIDVLLSWGTTHFADTAVRHDPRKFGISNYTFWTLFVHLFNMLTGFTTIPLQLASLLGLFFTGFGMLILTYVLLRYLIHGSTVPGFTFLASTIAIFSGAQLFTLGIIGEYLSRIHFRAMRKPPYVIGARS